MKKPRIFGGFAPLDPPGAPKRTPGPSPVSRKRSARFAKVQEILFQLTGISDKQTQKLTKYTHYTQKTNKQTKQNKTNSIDMAGGEGWKAKRPENSLPLIQKSKTRRECSHGTRQGQRLFFFLINRNSNLAFT